MKINLTFILNGFSWDTFQTAPSIVGTHQEDAMQDDEEQQSIHGSKKKKVKIDTSGKKKKICF